MKSFNPFSKIKNDKKNKNPKPNNNNNNNGYHNNNIRFASSGMSQFHSLPTSSRESFKEGGKIPKAGLYRLHKGEVVVPAYKVKVVDAALKKAGKKPLKKVCKTCVLSSKQLKKRKVTKRNETKSGICRSS